MELSEHLTSLVLALVFFGNLTVGNRTHRVAAPWTQLSGCRSGVATRWQSFEVTIDCRPCMLVTRKGLQAGFC